MAKVILGQLVMTAGVAGYMKDECADIDEVINLVMLHRDGNWGDVSIEDAKLNDEALESGEGRIMSSHMLRKERVWIITEGEGRQTTTTVQFPREY